MRPVAGSATRSSGSSKPLAPGMPVCEPETFLVTGSMVSDDDVVAAAVADHQQLALHGWRRSCCSSIRSRRWATGAAPKSKAEPRQLRSGWVPTGYWVTWAGSVPEVGLPPFITHSQRNGIGVAVSSRSAHGIDPEQEVVLGHGDVGDARDLRPGVVAVDGVVDPPGAGRGQRAGGGRGVAAGGRAVGGHVQLAVAVPDQVVGVAHAAGEDRDRRAGGEGVVARGGGVAVVGLDVERQAPASRLVSTRRTAPASRCSARRPQALSGAPMAVMLPWLM